jgi:hypothetical protein
VGVGEPQVGGWYKTYHVACDRQGHWLRNVGVPPGTWLEVYATVGNVGKITGWTSAYGWGIP